MRDVNRLYGFYNTLMQIHMENYPDLRFGQLIMIFERWLQVNKKINDMFYIEEDEMLSYLNEFVQRC